MPVIDDVPLLRRSSVLGKMSAGRCGGFKFGWSIGGSFPGLWSWEVGCVNLELLKLTSPAAVAILGIFERQNRVLIMVTTVQKWGNSQGLRLNKQVLQNAHISVGDEVDVAVREGVIIIAPVKLVRGKHILQELVSRMPKNYKTTEVSWGEPIGREAW